MFDHEPDKTVRVLIEKIDKLKDQTDRIELSQARIIRLLMRTPVAATMQLTINKEK
jgi:hypothetical protein